MAVLSPQPPPIDEILLRRFGWVRAVGGTTYILVVAVAFLLIGADVWPLLAGVVVLAVVTALYFFRSFKAPRASVTLSLVADLVVLATAIGVLGGTSAGFVGLYAIVVVSAGILLGAGAAAAFTALAVALSFGQLALEGVGVEPAILYNPDLESRLTILLVSLAGLVSVGYLATSYGGRLHERLAEAGAAAEDVRRRGRRRLGFVRQASRGAQAPLAAVEAVADELDLAALSAEDAQRLASRLRVSLLQLESEVGQLADVGSLDATAGGRPELLSLPDVVTDSIHALGERLAGHPVQVDVEPVKVQGNRRAARRVVHNLLENVVDHTPSGTRVTIATRATASSGVLVIADDGPGIDPADLPSLFDADGTGPRVGLPLVRELSEGMGATVRAETPRAGGTRFLVAFRLAPGAAPLPGETPSLAARTERPGQGED